MKEDKIKFITDACISANPDKNTDCFKCGQTMMFAEGDFVCFGCWYKTKKPNHRIQLADILLAIEAKRQPNEFKLDIDTKGYITLYDFEWKAKGQIEYNLKKTFEEQEPEFYDWLYNLLK